MPMFKPQNKFSDMAKSAHNSKRQKMLCKGTFPYKKLQVLSLPSGILPSYRI